MGLLDLQPLKISKRVEDYSLFIYGPSKIGKTTFIHELYGDRVLMLMTEDRYGAIGGAMVKRIYSWAEFLSVLAELNNPLLKERYDAISIDTVENLHDMLGSYVCAKWKENKIGERQDVWGADHVDMKNDWKKWCAQKISLMGYKPIFVSHAIQETVKVPVTDYDPNKMTGIGQMVTVKEKVAGEEKKQDVQYFEYAKYTPDLKQKVFAPLNKVVDNILFLTTGVNSNGEEVRVIHLRESLQWLAGSTHKYIEKTIPLSAAEYRKAVELAIDKEDVNNTTETVTHERPEGPNFEDLMNEAKELGGRIHKANKDSELVSIVEKHFGIGVKLTGATEDQIELLQSALVDLQLFVGKNNL